jgi:hypothetical protein
MGVGRGRKPPREQIMDELLLRMWDNLVARVGGPMSFRLVLQPAVAAILAIRAGVHDARDGRPPYFWTILTNPDDRRELLRQGWTAVAKVFLAAVVIDVVYQLVVARWVYPGETLLVAFLLACVPYLLIRGLVNRLVRSRRSALKT